MFVITSADNDKLKTIRKLQQKRWRTKLGLFSAEGEDLIRPDAEFVLRSGVDVEPELLDAVSTLGSGTRVIGVYKQRWAEPTGDVLVYLHGVEEVGLNVLAGPEDELGAGPDEVLPLGAEQPELGPPALLLELPDGLELLVVG